MARRLIPDIENHHAPGFALLFPTAGVMLPSLYEAASQQPLPLSEMMWDPDEQRVWEWKDELPRKGLAWSGRLLHGGRASFLCPDLLADCYPHAGAPDDFRQAPLSEEARRVAETLLASGPLPAAATWLTLGITALPCAFSLRDCCSLPAVTGRPRTPGDARPTRDRADLTSSPGSPALAHPGVVPR